MVLKGCYTFLLQLSLKWFSRDICDNFCFLTSPHIINLESVVVPAKQILYFAAIFGIFLGFLFYHPDNHYVVEMQITNRINLVCGWLWFTLCAWLTIVPLGRIPSSNNSANNKLVIINVEFLSKKCSNSVLQIQSCLLIWRDETGIYEPSLIRCGLIVQGVRDLLTKMKLFQSAPLMLRASVVAQMLLWVLVQICMYSFSCADIPKGASHFWINSFLFLPSLRYNWPSYPASW